MSNKGGIILSQIYKHTKTGNLYLILHEGKETENATPVVIYQALYGDCEIWVRSAYEFYSFMEINGDLIPRFKNVKIEKL